MCPEASCALSDGNLGDLMKKFGLNAPRSWKQQQVPAPRIRRGLSSIATTPAYNLRTVGYRTRMGDSLRRIARHTLGDEGRWEEIWALNRRVIPNPGRLLPGIVLVLPRDANPNGGQ